MTEIGELASRQRELGEQISAIVRNYKKDPAERKQTAAYFKKRLDNLKAYWENFETNDIEINEQHQGDKSHEYFAKNYFGEILKLKNQYQNEFEEKLQELAAQEIASANQNVSNAGELKQVQLMIRRQNEFGKSIHRQLKGLESSTETSKVRRMNAKETIQRLWNQYENLHFNIWEAVEDPTTIGYNMEEFINLEDKVRNAILKIEESLEPQVNSNTTAHQATPNATATVEVAKLNLPRIVIPKFGGNYLEWKQFHDLFNEVVHRQPIAKCQKMFLLKGNLEGEAAKLIAHLTVAEDHYESAWELLRQRYNNKRLLVNAYIAKLVSQPNISVESANAIKQLHDTTKECILGLKNLSLDIDQWDPILIFLIMKKLDSNTHNLFEQTVKSPRELQSLKNFLDFLELRFQALETIGGKGSNKACLNATNASARCMACKDDHRTSTCKKYLKLSPENRRKMIIKAKSCVNCLRPGHISTKCTTEGCSTCKKRHHKTLHDYYSKPAQTTEHNSSSTKENAKAETSPPAATTSPPAATLTTSIVKKPQQSYGLLGTAMVSLKHRKGHWVELRALLDSCSQINIITEKAARKLGLPQQLSSMDINGVGRCNKSSKKCVYANISSKYEPFDTTIEAYSMPEITNNQPSIAINIHDWPIPNGVVLADPDFNHPGPIDILLGVEIYNDIVQMKRISLGDNLPVLQKTVFGWVVTGKIRESATTSAVSTCAILTKDIELDLQKFWELEEVQSESTSHTIEEQQCEDHFNRTVERTQEGRFIVKLPFKEDPHVLGSSIEMAKQRFFSVERRLNLNPELKADYKKFMHEYEQLGHMTEINPHDVVHPAYFLPHHGVVRPESSTTKLRVVFDASATASRNVSLNDLLYTGPTIQDALFTILLRFRLFKYVFTADIEKMYRQILVNKEDRRFQLIFWRDSEEDPLKIYQLNTVTYGTTSAPYMAIRCLQRLAQIEEANHPTAAVIVKRDFYVDDVMSGFNSITEALHAQKDLIQLLKKGGFKLRKWCSNNPKLTEELHYDDVAIKLDVNSMENSHLKTLGQTWNPIKDEFQIRITQIEHGKYTKRTVSSDISRIFDPLGILGPVTVEAKLFLQHLWVEKMDWDTKLPDDLHAKWEKYMKDLSSLNDIKIPRHVFAKEIPNSIQLHAFADASERAYGSVVYIRSISPTGTIIVRLLCSRNRLAPIKKLTTPRLELCAAVLAAQLAMRVRKCISQPNVKTYLWSDSEIVLSWINASSASYHAFVANRIAKIQELSERTQWHHVKSKENPADILSRGIAASKLTDNNMWFYGPMFLHGSESQWSAPYSTKSQCQLEMKRTVVAATAESIKPHFIHTIDHRNSFTRLARITAYIIRSTQGFLKALAKDTEVQLSVSEIEKAKKIILRLIQEEQFADEIKLLKHGREVNNSSSIKGYNPFLDEHGLIRVGGRLQNSTLPPEAKHQILLPDHEYTRMLMLECHINNKHVGPKGLTAIVKQQYWPLKAGTTARSIVHKCVRCTKAKPTLMKQIMGNLPAERVEPARAFLNTGVDFWGPIETHYKVVRGRRPTKSYVAVFCCFATKAIHMEVVTDLTTDAFIMALKRFISTRGMCRKIFCDNATNFVGAKNELADFKEAIFHSEGQEKLKNICCLYNIDFRFIPARAPHFGGLWEAAVKSAKHLFKRSATSASLTHEELETLVKEIEAILNSRPLTQMSSDPNDLAALTPGHFLIGHPLNERVDPDATSLQLCWRKRWERIVQMQEGFWQRWKKEYLIDLQNRVKWRQNTENIKIGQLVLIHEDNTPSLQWRMGRVTELCPGTDGKVRVVNIRTKNGTIKRAIHRLAPLPVETEISAIHEQCPAPKAGSSSSNSTQGVALHVHAAKKITKTTEMTDTESSSKKKRRMSLSSMLVTTLLACLVSSANCSPIIETFQTPGIYFESIGTANILSSEWNLVIYYNLTSFWRAWDTIKKGTNALEHICNQYDKHVPCGHITSLYRQWQSDLESENVLLTKNSRQKRGALNFVGNVANTLFGVMDSKSEEEIIKKFEDIKNNESQLTELFQNHTSIIDATLNIVKQTQQNSQQKFAEVDHEINEILTRENNISNYVQATNIFHRFTTLALEVLTLTQNFQMQQQAVLETITDGRHGKINPLLISTNQLKAELQTIRTHLRPDFQLPMPDDDILQYYQLTKIQSTIMKDQIVFTLTLPLTNAETFELFQLSPIPASINATLVIITPISGYIGINLQKDQLYAFSNLAACTEAKSGRYLCPQTQPIYLANSEFGRCEMDLFHNRKNHHCEFQRINQSIIWFQLHRSNQWIYGAKGTTSINLICNNTVQHIRLTQAGRLEIQNDCMLKHEQLIIHGHHIYTTELRKAYARLTTGPPLDEFMTLPKMTYNPSNYAVSPEEIKALRQDLKAASTNGINFHHVHHYVANYITLAFLLALAITFIIYYRRKTTRNTPIPAQRTNQSAEQPKTPSSAKATKPFVVNINE